MSAFSDALSALSPFGGAISGLTDTGEAVIAFFTAVTDGKMWRSLGWLFLGIFLFFFGLYMFLHWPTGTSLPRIPVVP
jgi:hypothetical protein